MEGRGVVEDAPPPTSIYITIKSFMSINHPGMVNVQPTWLEQYPQETA